MKINQLNRFQAFGGHLLGSVLVGLCSAALVFLVWYPWPFSFATGVTAIFVLLLSVDVIIGPCITLIVFNPAKKELKRDLTIVLLLQIGALLYGLHIVQIERPVYYVFGVDRFDLVYASDLTPENLAQVTDARFKTAPLTGPELVAAYIPGSDKERNEILFNAMARGEDLPQLPQYYVPYAERKQQVLDKAQPLDKLKPFNSARESEISSLIEKYSSIKEGVGFLPLRGKVEDLAVIVRKDSAEILEIKDLKPWE